MKDTISEYARLLIVLLCFGMLVLFVFSGRWFNILGQASDAMENKITTQRQDAVFDELATRTPPVIEVYGISAYVGQRIPLMNLNGNYPDVRDANGNDISMYTQVFCDSEDFDKDSKTLTPSGPGIYTVTYRVVDKYGLTSFKTINIIVN